MKRHLAFVMFVATLFSVEVSRSGPQDVKSVSPVAHFGRRQECLYHPRDFVRTTSYTVPVGQRLVITGIGKSPSGGGQIEVHVQSSLLFVAGGFDGIRPIVSVPEGVTVDGGQFVSVMNGGYLIGYLVADDAYDDRAHMVECVPDPREYFRLEESSTPFTVPAGQAFVLTSFGSRRFQQGTNVDFEIGGSARIRQGVAFPTISTLPRGFIVPEGQVITLSHTGLTSPQPVAFGYLVDV